MVSRLAFVAAAVLSAVGLAIPLPASANDPPRVRAACTADAKRLCPQYKTGTPELRYCMEGKARSISHGCVRALEDAGIVPRGTLANGRKS